MADSLNVAIVGYGMAGKVFHAPLIQATAGLDLTVVVSSDAAKVHADLPDVRVVADLDSVLHDDAIDLVVIATPDHLHAEQAMAVLRAGKNVVIDKPFAPKLSEARAVAVCAVECGGQVSIFQNRRWDADFLTVKRLIAENALGEIVQFESHFDRYRPVIKDGWKGERDAGLWQDLGPHLIDQAYHLFGMPKAVFADFAAQRNGASAPDYFHAVLRYSNLRVILHSSQSTMNSNLRFAVHGTKGSYIKHGLDSQEDQSIAGLRPADADWGLDPVQGVLTQIKDGIVTDAFIENERGNSPAFYAGVRDAIFGHGDNPVPPEQALAVMEIIDAGITSARERREILLG